MKATAKILILAFLTSAVSIFCTSCESSSSSNVNKPYGAGGTTTSAILGRSRAR